MSPRQCRAARALIGWSEADLAGASGLGIRTVKDFEQKRRQNQKDATINVLRLTLERAGIRFIEDENEVGVARRTAE